MIHTASPQMDVASASAEKPGWFAGAAKKLFSLNIALFALEILWLIWELIALHYGIPSSLGFLDELLSSSVTSSMPKLGLVKWFLQAWKPSIIIAVQTFFTFILGAYLKKFPVIDHIMVAIDSFLVRNPKFGMACSLIATVLFALLFVYIFPPFVLPAICFGLRASLRSKDGMEDAHVISSTTPSVAVAEAGIACSLDPWLAYIQKNVTTRNTRIQTLQTSLLQLPNLISVAKDVENLQSYSVGRISKASSAINTKLQLIVEICVAPTHALAIVRNVKASLQHTYMTVADTQAIQYLARAIELHAQNDQIKSHWKEVGLIANAKMAGGAAKVKAESVVASPAGGADRPWPAAPNSFSYRRNALGRPPAPSSRATADVSSGHIPTHVPSSRVPGAC